MASMQDIKRRIKSVKSTQQITKAMKMVSAAKLRRTQGSLLALRPYAARVEEVVGYLRQSAVSHPYLEGREVKKVCYVVFTTDRGLCGGYNGSLLRYAEGLLQECGTEYGLIVAGSHGQEYFTRLNRPMDRQLPPMGDVPTYEQGTGLAQTLSSLYLNGEYDEIRLVYTQFLSAMTQKPVCRRLLPVPEAEEASRPDDFADYIFEPSEQELLGTLLPLYLEVCVYRALLEAKASEHGARMTAMNAATDNALEMIDQLTLSLNRARQAAITTEITEIVGGASALSGAAGG